jgi:aromatic ring-opening dioxygenase catalytic subunit (LigB family)
MNETTLMPAAFIGHGSPMNTLESNRYTSAWQGAAAGDVTLGHYVAKSEAQLRAGWQAVANFVEEAARGE